MERSFYLQYISPEFRACIFSLPMSSIESTAARDEELKNHEIMALRKSAYKKSKLTPRIKKKLSRENLESSRTDTGGSPRRARQLRA